MKTDLKLSNYGNELYTYCHGKQSSTCIHANELRWYAITESQVKA